MGWQERELDPAASPQADLGFRMRAARNRLGWSLQRLSVEVQFSQSYLAKVERGEQLPHRDVIVSCDNALKCAGELVRRFDGIKDAESVHVSNDVSKPLGSLGHTPGQREAWDSDVPMSVSLFDPEGRMDVVMVPGSSLRHGPRVTASGIILPGQAGRVGGLARPVEHFQHVRRTLADLDNEFGPRAAIPRAREQYEWISRIVMRQRGDDARDYLQVMTQYADLLGWLYQDSGMFAEASQWLDQALNSASLSDDKAAVAFIMARKAQLYSDMHKPDLAAMTADAAVRIASNRSAIAPIAATYAARGHALAGDEHAAMTSYDQAQSLLSGVDDDGSPWGKFFCDSYLDIQRAHSLVDLGRYAEAASRFRAAINALPPGFRRDEGVYLAWEATAHAGSGEPEQAAASANIALDIALDTKSSRIVAELLSLDTALKSMADAPDVVRFRERLHSHVRQQA